MLPELVPSGCMRMPCLFVCFFLFVFFVFSNYNPGLTMTIFMTVSNLFPDASVWMTDYTAYSHECISKFVLIQHILSTQVSDTGPMVLWLL